MRNPHRAALLGVIAIGSLASCSGSETADTTVASTDTTTIARTALPTTTTTTTTEVNTTTTTEAQPTSTIEPTTTTPAPEAEVAIDDFEYIIEELSRRRVAMYAEPDLDAIPRICAVGSPCEDLYTAQIGEQIELGERTVGEPSLDVTEFEIVGFDKDTLEESAAVVVRYTAAPLGDSLGAIVDENGDVVIELAVESPNDPVEGQMNLVRNNEPGLPWRILSQQ